MRRKFTHCNIKPDQFGQAFQGMKIEKGEFLDIAVMKTNVQWIYQFTFRNQLSCIFVTLHYKIGAKIDLIFCRIFYSPAKVIGNE